MKRALLELMIASAVVSGLAWAQEDEGPGRGVARISLINGDVSVRRGDSGDWVAGAVNAPLVALDHVVTGVGSRAELQFDWATFLRLSSDSEVRFAELENRRYQVQVSRGTVTLSVLRDTDADVEVDTPNVSVRPVKRGEIRITVRENGESEVTVRSGEAEAFTPRGVERVHSGRTMLVRGTAADPEYQFVRAMDEDTWDRWNEDRDRRIEKSQSYRYVSRDIYGADELDGYGRWVNVAPYGPVWCPNGMAADWAPYRYGRWTWVDWYGWSWVSYDPWGWAPYHYGRWFWGAPYGWCWFPGPIHNRHYWRPALVGFFGWGPGGFHGDFGFGFGNIGWVPLAPYEPFHPWYGRGYYGRRAAYIDNSVTIVNNVNITNVYRNARVVNGVTGLDSGGFARGGRGSAIRVSDAIAHNAALVRGPIPVTPSNDSLRLSDRQLSVMPRVTQDRQFYTRRQPAQVERVSFQDQRQNMEQMVRRTVGEHPGGAIAPAGGPAVGGARVPGVVGGGAPATSPTAGAAHGGVQNGPVVRLPATAERPNAGEPGWRRSETPQQQGTPVREGAGAGWRRFGEGPARQTAPARTAPETNQPAAPARGAQENQNWQRFGGDRRNSTPERSADAPAARREDAPVRQEAPARREQAAPPAARREDAPVRREQAAPPARTERPAADRPAADRPQREQLRRDSASPRSDAQGTWQHFGTTPSEVRVEHAESTPNPTWRRDWPSAPTAREQRAGTQSMSFPRAEARSEPRSEAPRYSQRSEPIHLNAPIVRERALGYQRSAPSFERSAPRVERAAPSAPRGGGERGGGGAARSNAGGGGRGRMR